MAAGTALLAALTAQLGHMRVERPRRARLAAP
jgi:hypothetical protein